MKRAVFVAFALLFLAVLAWWLQRNLSTAAKIAHHQDEWRRSKRAMFAGTPLPLLHWLNVFRENEDFNPQEYWREKMQYHQTELVRLGYLTNCELRLTNQIMTRAFHSNFFVGVQNELGTNAHQIWSGTPRPNHTGLNLLIPAKDVAALECIFRECAAKYAANVPPVLSTSESRP
jgi:hypothetical protein